MDCEKVKPGRGAPLRKNNSEQLTITIEPVPLDEIYIINGPSLFHKNIKKSNLIILPEEFYMIINISKKNELEIHYDKDISNHQVIYDPYKYENEKKKPLRIEDIINQFKIPEGYIDVLPKWYSFKFTYPDFNLIFIKPKLGISFQIHDNRNERWQIVKGNPIIIIGNKVYYNVENEKEFEIPINTIHSVINTNSEEYVVLKERWTGKFDEKDIYRIFNPNNYR
ncbi:MAG: hypothetical protein ACFFBP_10940 [Promethearchaeota archaeon]